MEVRLKEKIPGVFWPVHQAIRRGEVTEVVAKGGRGSGKSSYLSMELVWQLLRHPDCHAVVLRKVGGTLRNSVYNQIVWAIGELGCAGYFRCTVSPMECTYLPTGQKILFFGTDDPGKLKSLKLPFGAVGICWFEELDQFDSPEEVRNVEQTVLRGGSWTLTLKSFNPPAMARSWANRYALETRPGKLVHHSTYRDLPRAMLGERFWADAEHLQRTNPAAFRHEYGGEVVGSGTAVFANLQLRAVPDDELERYDRVYYGVDWGWYPDPWAYNAAAYDAARRVLVIFDELTRSRTPNRETAELLLARGAGTDGPLTADAAEPKSCADYRAAGLPCRAAQKGPGSVRESMKWLQGLAAIIIDPVRCPATAAEFSEYEYERDPRTGEVLPGYPDVNNHHIDAVRYAVEGVGLAVLKTPLMNCVDGSTDAVSIYAPAAGLLHALARCEEQLNAEFANGASRVFASEDLLRPDAQGRRALQDDLFVGLPDDPANVGVTVYSPTLREGSYLARKQDLLRGCESLLGLRRGILSEVETPAEPRTATEIAATSVDYDLTIRDLQSAWTDTVQQAMALCSALGAVYGLDGLPQTAAPAIDWGDGVLYDRARIWAEQRELVDAGLLRPELALAWYFDLPHETEAELAEIRRRFMGDAGRAQ